MFHRNLRHNPGSGAATKIAPWGWTEGAILFGVRGQNRTDDTRIFNPLLYRLSYPDAPEKGRAW